MKNEKITKVPESTEERKQGIENPWGFVKVLLIVVAVAAVLSIPFFLHQYLPIELEGTVVAVEGESVVVSAEDNFGYWVRRTYVDKFENNTERELAIGDKIMVRYKNDEPIEIIEVY